MKPIVQREFRGINTLDPFSIDSAFATEVKNLTSSKYPAASTRPGYSVLKTQGTTKVLGMGVWKDRELHVVFNDGTWHRLKDGTWTQLLSGLNTSATWYFTNFKGGFADINLIATNGVDAPKRYDGTSVTNLGGAPATLNYIEQHDNRLYGMVSNILYFSELSVGTNWTTTSGNDSDPGQIVIENAEGETVNGLLGGAGHIVIFQPSDVFELYGTSPSDYRKIPAADDIGLANGRCRTVLDAVIYFMGRGGIYAYSGGARPNKLFSRPVQKYIDALSTTDLANCSMGTDGRYLYVYIPGKILEFNPEFGTWYVWEDISAACFARVGSSFYVGDTSGRVLLIGGETDNGTAISGYWISKVFASETLVQVIRWIRAWVSASVTSGTVKVYMSKTENGNDWEYVGDASDDAINIRSTTLANAKMLRAKIEFTGVMTLRAFSRDEETLPLR